MLVLVTGGQGFIGSHLCERLAAKGYRVRVLARPTSDLSHLDGLDTEVVRGDLGRDGDLTRAVAGSEWIIHLAGALKGFNQEEFLQVNREGTRRLTEACRAGAPHLSRFVLVSSLAALGPSPGGEVPIPEDGPARPLTWYGRSKLEAEEVLRNSGLPWSIVRPPIVFGPRDRDLLSFFRIVRRGLLPVPGRKERSYSLVYAPDLADGIIRVSESSASSGEAFHLAGPEVVTWRGFGEKIAAALGGRCHVLRLPEALVRASGTFADRSARLRGRPHIFSSQKVIEMLAPAWVASPRKAQELLGWTSETPLDEALARTVRWYRDQGWL
jgi:dihydroflavonol-4-reductase